MAWFQVFRPPEGATERDVKHPPELALSDSRPFAAPRAPCGSSQPDDYEHDGAILEVDRTRGRSGHVEESNGFLSIS